MPAPRAALYLRVSTGRQAENDLSIPDQRRQAEAYCQAKGWEVSDCFIEPGASATDDRRPEFQRLMEAATSKPCAFEIVVVHSFSRFFRDHFELEFNVRRLEKNGVKLVSITQELDDSPTSMMMRQIMAVFCPRPTIIERWPSERFCRLYRNVRSSRGWFAGRLAA